MLRIRPSVGGMILACCAAPLAAQTNAECGSYILPAARNLCDASIDGARLFTPVAGILISGGNPFLGSTGGLGGFPHTAITLRANATRIVIPDLSYNGEGRTVGAKSRVIAPAPLVEGALGLFRGASGGHLAVVLLGSAQLLPTKLIDDVRVDVDATRIGSIALGLGYGARVTVIGDHGALPAVTVSWMKRHVPRIGVGNVTSGDKYSFATDLSATNYRVTVGKQFGPLMLGAGIGRDEYSGDASISFRDPISLTPQVAIPVALSDKRTMKFVDAGLNAGKFYLIGEAGYLQGKDLGLGTTFADNDPKSRRFFGSVGLRFGF